MNTTELSQYCLATEIRQDLGNFFPSKHSFDWFVRQNRSDLARSGALIIVAGRHMFHRERLAKVILDKGIRNAIGELQ